MNVAYKKNSFDEKTKESSNYTLKNLIALLLIFSIALITGFTIFLITGVLINSLVMVAIVVSVSSTIWLSIIITKQLSTDKNIILERLLEDKFKEQEHLVLDNIKWLSRTSTNGNETRKMQNKFGIPELYIKYRILYVQDLHKILYHLNNLYTILFLICDYKDFNFQERNIRFGLLGTAMRMSDKHEEYKLIINEIYTGNSITIKPSNKWTPKIKQENGETIIYIHKKSLPVILLGMLVGGMLNTAIDFQKNFLEIQLLKKQIQEYDRNEMIDKENARDCLLYIDRFESNLNRLSDEQIMEIGEQMEELRRLLVHNDSIITVQNKLNLEIIKNKQK